MRKSALLRGIMLVAGLLAVCAILMSPSFSQVKKEKAADKETVLIPAPSEAIPGTAIKVDEPEVPLLTQLDEPEQPRTRPLVRTDQVARYLKVLFRTLIAPNAP